MAGVFFFVSDWPVTSNVSVPLSRTKTIRAKGSLFTDGQLSITDSSPKRLGMFVPTVYQSTLFTLIETLLQWPPPHNVQLNSGPGGCRCREVELYVHIKMDCTLTYSSKVALSCAKFLEDSRSMNVSSSVPRFISPACK